VARALQEADKETDESVSNLMLSNHFESTLPSELNADFHALLKRGGFTQRAWKISDPKARHWCVTATRNAQKTKGEVDPATGKGKITVEAVKSRCSPVIEVRVDVEHTCVTVEEAKRHFTKCNVEAQVSLTRYVVDLDDELNFGYLKDPSFGKEGTRDFRASIEQTHNVAASDDAPTVSRSLLETVSAEAAVAIHTKMDDAAAFARN